MHCRAALLFSAVAGTLAAQSGTTPKASVQDYPAHATAEKLSIGAEYLVHSFSSGREMFIAKDYLVVEVALYPANGDSLLVSSGQFGLRVNGRSQALPPHAPEAVAHSLKYPDRDTGPHTVAAVGPVIFGQPAPAERFPGDPNARTAPPLPRAPDDNPSGLDKEPPVKPEELVVQAALPDGEHHGPTSGFLYFPYRGNVGRIRSLELVFAGPGGSIALPLM
ncbi:MAG TPA: hypothetical protein VN924_16770 [Bryobacteraceae bacterium]|nr:hypothetical protein [Bryobacteraceae bacterium]